MEEEIIDYIRQILVKEHHLYNVPLQPTSNFHTDLRLDSLDVMEIAMKLEQKYQITLTYTVGESIDTVQDLADIVCDKLNHKNK